MRHRLLRIALVIGSLSMASLYVASTPTDAFAQEADPADPALDTGDGEEPVSDGPVAPAPADTSALEERLSRLEASEAADDEQLAAALQRVETLEAELASQRAQAQAQAQAQAESVPELPADEAPEPEAASGPTVRPLASLFTRFEHREGYQALNAGNPGCFPGANDGDCLRYRAEVGLMISDLRVSDEVVAAVRFRPQVAGFYSFGGTSGGVSQPALGLYEGNLILAVGDAIRFDIGRLVLNYGDQLVVGSLRWHPAGRSFDGARMRILPGPEGVWVDLFWSMLNEGGANGFGDGDGYFYGAYANLGPLLGDDFALDAYALARQTNDTVDAMGLTVPWSLRVHLGGRFKWTMDMLDVRAEAGLQVGRATSTEAIIAGHLDAEVGVRLLDGMLRFSGHGFVASGDDPGTAENEGYNQLFPTAHLFLGLTEVMGARGNAYGGALHAQVKPVPQLTFALDGLVFGRPQAMAENFTGAEIDAQAIWRPGAGFRIRGLYGIFIPNSGFYGAGADPVHHVEAEIGYELN